jgi:hypothetical protein
LRLKFAARRRHRHRHRHLRAEVLYALVLKLRELQHFPDVVSTPRSDLQQSLPCPSSKMQGLSIPRRDLEHLGKVLHISLIHVASLTRAQGTDFDNWDNPNFDPTATILQDESPYTEVRSAVANTDDPMIPSSNFRPWVVGII